jgi:hypothetical protein
VPNDAAVEGGQARLGAPLEQKRGRLGNHYSWSAFVMACSLLAWAARL